MIIICHGMVKSASSFATQITSRLIEGHCQKFGGRRGDLREFEPETNGTYLHTTEDIDACLSKMKDKYGDCGEYFVIKWHGMPTQLIADLVRSKSLAAISTYRNPLDISLSLMDVARKEEAAGEQRFARYRTIEDTVGDIDYQIRTHLRWAEIEGVAKIYFDDLAQRPQEVARRISDLLGIQYDEEVVANMTANKQARIWEFNKGIVDRYKTEMSQEDRQKWGQYWQDFLTYIESSRKPGTSTGSP